MGPNHTPVLSPRRDNGHPDHEWSLARVLPLRLPIKRRAMSVEDLVERSSTVPSAQSYPDLTSPSRLACQEALPSFHHLVERSGTAPSAHSHPDLTSTSRPACQEALHSHQHSTLAATMNIWHRHNDQWLSAHFDKPTDALLDRRLKEHSPLIEMVKLQLVINLAVKRRFEVTTDFTQWKDFARAVRIEHVAPVDEVQHENIFLPDIQAAMEIMYDEVGPLDGEPNDCERVLSAAEDAVDEVFFRRDLYLEMA